LGLGAERLVREDVDAPAVGVLLQVRAEVVQRDVGGVLLGLVEREAHGAALATTAAAVRARVAVAVPAATGSEQQGRGGGAGDEGSVLPVPHVFSVLRSGDVVVRRGGAAGRPVFRIG